MQMNLYHKKHIDAEEIPLALGVALKQFNDAIGTSYSEESIKIAYCTFETFPSVYKKFCKSDFPSWLLEDYTNPAFYADVQAAAFVEGDKAGILINTSVSFSMDEWVHDLMHEIAHIFAAQNEYLGRSFYTECCDNEDISVYEDTMYIGYAVWREFIADYITAFTTPHEPRPGIEQYRLDIKRFDSVIQDYSRVSLKAVSLVLAAIFTCKDYMDAESLEEFREILEKKNLLNLNEYDKLIVAIFDKVNDETIEPHIINEDFIDTLGSLIRHIVSNRRRSNTISKKEE